MKIWGNIRHITRNYMPKFQPFRICHKGERTIFLRGPKTYGSPCSIVKDDLNSMISKIIQFTFSEATAIIDDLIIIPGDESFNERMLTGISYLNIYNNNSLFLFR